MNFVQAIDKATRTLSNAGRIVHTKTIQGVESPTPMWEALNVTLRADMPSSFTLAINQINPNVEWADEHFEERVCGEALNPPPSHIRWPYAKDKNDKFRFDERFSHTYPERFWPKVAGIYERRLPNGVGIGNWGIRYQYGDLNNLMSILRKDPYTRQAFLPIWFPEDLTAADEGMRVPCSLGYQFIIREDYLHIIYFIRSCDYFRHFRDDIYLAWRLAEWVKKKLEMQAYTSISLGTFTMHITSLHCFLPEKSKL
jgi:thymidylate synthase